MDAELEYHLGYPKHLSDENNSRNGHPEKTMLTENQSITIEVPRDRKGSFKPVIIPKYKKHVHLFNDLSILTKLTPVNSQY